MSTGNGSFAALPRRWPSRFMVSFFGVVPDEGLVWLARRYAQQAAFRVVHVRLDAPTRTGCCRATVRADGRAEAFEDLDAWLAVRGVFDLLRSPSIAALPPLCAPWVDATSSPRNMPRPFRCARVTSRADAPDKRANAGVDVEGVRVRPRVAD